MCDLKNTVLISKLTSSNSYKSVLASQAQPLFNSLCVL